ncbi:hypothetical protein ACLOJK_000573 [Asimina triloba]
MTPLIHSPGSSHVLLLAVSSTSVDAHFVCLRVEIAIDAKRTYVSSHGPQPYVRVSSSSLLWSTRFVCLSRRRGEIDEMEEQMRRENGDDGRRTKEEDDEQEKKPEMSSEESGGNENPQPRPVMAFNHVSRLCRDAEASFHFYANVLGFVPVKRPQAFNFDGAWYVRCSLFNSIDTPTICHPRN